MSFLKDLEQNKSAESYYQQSLMFKFGSTDEEKEKKRLSLLTLAANQGHVVAQNELGFLYLRGGVYVPERDVTKAFDLFSLSSKQNFKDAIFNLAYCYEFGHGTVKNVKKSTELWSSIGLDRNEVLASHEGDIEREKRIKKEVQLFLASFAAKSGDQIVLRKKNGLLNLTPFFFFFR